MGYEKLEARRFFEKIVLGDGQPGLLDLRFAKDILLFAKSGQVRSGLHAKLASPFRAQAQKASTLHGILYKIKSGCSMYSKIR